MEKKYLGVTAAVCALVAIFLVSVASYWHGFGPAGDAERYVDAALAWAEQGPYLGETHWALRHLYVLPMAAFYRLFGPSEFATTLPNILYAAGLVAVTFYFARRFLSEAEAFFAAAFVAVSAFLVARPMEIGVYGAEAMFAVTACWLFIGARQDGGARFALLAATGLFSGLAWTMREQTAYLMVAFGLLVMLERKQILLSLVALGAGFGSVIFIELVVYFLASGDPFYRYNVDLHHRAVGWDAVIENPPPWYAAAIRPFKDALDDPITTPLLFLSLGTALLMGGRMRPKASPRRDVFLVFGVVSVVSAVITSYVFDFAKPRYFPVLHYAVVLFCGCAVIAIADAYGKKFAAAFAMLVVFLNLAGEDFSNYNEYAEARWLATYAQKSDEQIFTDPMTASRARRYLRLKGASEGETSEKLRHEDAPQGALFFKAYSSGPRPNSEVCVLIREENVRPASWTHALLRQTGADGLVGAKVKEIARAPRPVELVRVTSEPVESDPVTGRRCLPAK